MGKNQRYKNNGGNNYQSSGQNRNKNGGTSHSGGGGGNKSDSRQGYQLDRKPDHDYRQHGHSGGRNGATYCDGAAGQHHLPSTGESKQRGMPMKKNCLQCPKCNQDFDLDMHKPRILKCGHSLCTRCLYALIGEKAVCPECLAFLPRHDKVEDFPVNYSAVEVVRSTLASESTAKQESKNDDSMSTRPKSGPERPVITAASRSENRNGSLQDKSRNGSLQDKTEKMDWAPSQKQKSPHDSMCIERGKKPTHHCATCLVWVCGECGSIDHVTPRCYLIPKKEALTNMTKAQVDGAKGSIESLKNHLTEMTLYEENLEAFSLVMQAAFESIKTEQKRVAAMKKEGEGKIEDVNALTKSLASNNNLPDALTWLQHVEDKCGSAQHWISKSAMNLLDLRELKRLNRGILHSTVLMKMMAESEAKESGGLLAQHTVDNKVLSSHLAVDGRRIFVHALRRVDTVPKGYRAVPLTHIIACLDQASTLAFLDVGWKGKVEGRVLIRLLGDTQRGRQFIALCLGHYGGNLRNTSFHRIWWKGESGQNIWGGDIKKGDGSGVAPLLKFTDEEKKSIPSGRNLTIDAGLVAGSYETTDVSTIFRIYTSDQSSRSSYTFSREVEEAKDPAAFAKVEFGLDYLQSAGNLNNIQDLTIYDCGVVVEVEDGKF